MHPVMGHMCDKEIQLSEHGDGLHGDHREYDTNQRSFGNSDRSCTRTT